MQAILGIVISALATFLTAVLILKKSTHLRAYYFRTHLKLQGRLCSACGTHLQPTANFCSRCGESYPDDQQTSSHILPRVKILCTRPQTTPIQTNKEDSETNATLLHMKDELLKKKHKKKHKEESIVDSFIVDSGGYEQTKWDAQRKYPES
jgi:hypothetical protein